MDYFEARNLNGNIYENHKLPLHLKQIILDLKPDARILDFGCGFGQNLKAINTLIEKTSNGGGDILKALISMIRLLPFVKTTNLMLTKSKIYSLIYPKKNLILLSPLMY